MKHHVEMAGDQVVHARRGAAIGHVVSFVPVSDEQSPVRCDVVPMPCEPKVTLPGLASHTR